LKGEKGEKSVLFKALCREEQGEVWEKKHRNYRVKGRRWVKSVGAAEEGKQGDASLLLSTNRREQPKKWDKGKKI